MVLRSDGLCHNPLDWQQFAMQDRGFKPPEDVLACSRPSIQRRLKPPNEQALKCPRCESLNTKFCYYNNYSQSQPRHFCKNCRRYWTKGGALRNVPVGGGCRKNKRTKQRSTDQQQCTNHQSDPATATVGSQNSSCPLPENLSTGPSSSVYYNLPHQGDQIDLSVFARSQQALRLSDQPSLANCSSGLFGIAGSSQLSSLPHSTLASLSNHLSGLGSLQHLRNGLLGLDFAGVVRPEQGNLRVGELNTFFEPASHQVPVAPTVSANEGAHAFSLALDTLNGIDPDVHWKVHHEKLALQSEESRMVDGHVLIPFENHQQQAVDSLRHAKLRAGLSCMPKVEEEGRSNADWEAGQEAFYEQTAEPSYWNNGGAWPDLPAYGTTASTFL